MTFSVRIKASAARQLARLDVGTRRLLVQQIDRLVVDPHVGTVLKGELDGLRRVRVGAYRIVFEVRNHELLVLFVRVGHRSSVYRR
ncbi:MAG: type II toxin-antitoxin system RelE/ParE family toxin [Trueperaceae bacterium]|nr:MAG: type II toxin-antitoxin system RelE/ParE family toxin [Trueperaceae bacterium]